MYDAPPPNESGNVNTPVDVDRLLETKPHVRLSSAPGSDGQSGFFSQDSRIVSILGNRFADPETRSILFSTSGDAVVLETTQSFPVSEHSTITIGRPDIGGDKVSRTHARVSRRAGKYLLEDMNSTNGTDLLKPTDIYPHKDGEDVHDRIAVISKIPSRMFIGLSDKAIIEVKKVPNGPLMVTDAIKTKAGQRQQLATLNEGEALTIGRPGPGFPNHFEGHQYTMDDSDLDTAHLRLLYKDGELYLINVGRKEYSVASAFDSAQAGPKARAQQPPPGQGARHQNPPGPDPEAHQLRQKGPGPQDQSKAHAQQPRPNQAPPPPSDPKPSFDGGPLPARKVTTARLWSEMERFLTEEIEKARQEASAKGEQFDENKFYKQNARKYHPDLNRNNPNAHRAMQLVNRLLRK